MFSRPVTAAKSDDTDELATVGIEEEAESIDDVLITQLKEALADPVSALLSSPLCIVHCVLHCLISRYTFHILITYLYYPSLLCRRYISIACPVLLPIPVGPFRLFIPYYPSHHIGSPLLPIPITQTHVTYIIYPAVPITIPNSHPYWLISIIYLSLLPASQIVRNWSYD